MINLYLSSTLFVRATFQNLLKDNFQIVPSLKDSDIVLVVDPVIESLECYDRPVLVVDTKNKFSFLDLFKNQIRGFISYSNESDFLSNLTSAILSIFNGGFYIDIDRIQSILDFSALNSSIYFNVNSLKNKFSNLTDRQHEVLTAKLDFNCNKEVAKFLSISISTVASHLEIIKNKLGYCSNTDLISDYSFFARYSNLMN